MFANNRNLFFSNKYIKKLFQTVNFEQEKLSAGLRLSLNEGKTKDTLFNKSKNKDNISLKPPKVYMNQKELKRYHVV